jgi:serine/threonine protein phosphatase 1
VSTGRTFVIGDVHGCVRELNRLLDVIAPGEADTVCFLGDYIDRGPSSKDVIDRLLRLRQEGPRCVFLRGNHEDMFLAHLGYAGRYGEAFLWNGGDATLASYGLGGLRGSVAAQRLPYLHREFLLGLELTARFGTFLCVHAGIRPTRDLADQAEEDLLWIREEFTLAEHPYPVTVLYGHTPQRDVRLHLPYKVGLDTGLVYGNRLSCLELVSKEIVQVCHGSTKTMRRSLAGEFGRSGAVSS